MSVLSGIALAIIAVLLFELIIFFHEFGHFITAKKSGVQVNEFALGMGPKLFGFKKGETEYSLRLFPIGGYCSMEAEDEESDNPRAFTNAKIWKRMIIIISGAVMNIILGLILMFVIVVQSPSFASTTVESFPPRSYSACSGLQAGDTIVELNNYKINSSNDFSFAIATIKWDEYSGDSVNIYKQDCSSVLTDGYVEVYQELDEDSLTKLAEILTEGKEKIGLTTSQKEAHTVMSEYYSEMMALAGVEKFEIPEIEIKDTRKRFRTDMTVIRDGEKVELKDVDFYTYLASEDAEEPSVAIDFYVTGIEKNFLTVLQQTGAQTVSVVRMVWSSLVGLLTGQFGFSDMSGPVGIASAITNVASQGLETGFLDAVNNIIYVMMIITVNLGIFNMLPFPALDGGRFLFLMIEAIFRKPIPRKVEYIVNAVGLAILMVFALLVTIKDVWQLLPF